MFLGDLMKFDPATNTWENLTAKQLGTLPSPRARHGFSSILDKIYVFGGVDKNGAPHIPDYVFEKIFIVIILHFT
jgi:hypothetical protein